MELTEFRPSDPVQLTADDRALLRAVAPSIQIAPAIEGEGMFVLTPGAHIGAVHLPELDIIVRPKVGLDRVLFLLSYAMGRGRWDALPMGLGEADSLVEAIVPGFVFQLGKALIRGVAQGYRTEEESLQTIRGRLRVADQIRDRFGIAPPAEVSYDEFTEDIELNRILKAAMSRIGRLALRSNKWRWPLRALDNKLSQVQLVDYAPQRIPELHYDRLTDRYRPAAELARLVLASVSFDLSPGGVAASAFLIDMNKVFEDFVVVALRESMRVSDSTLVQGARGRRLKLDEGGRVSLEPDVSYWEGTQCFFVGDVKYKRLDPAGFEHADLYQLTAYTIATGLRRGLLIYAAGEEEPSTHRVVNLGNELEIVTFDLRQSPKELLAQVRRLADQILDLVRSERLKSAA